MSELQGIARSKFHEGELEEFKHLSAQCMEIVRTKDTGTLHYEISLNHDQSEYMVLARYRDSVRRKGGSTSVRVLRRSARQLASACPDDRSAG